MTADNQQDIKIINNRWKMIEERTIRSILAQRSQEAQQVPLESLCSRKEEALLELSSSQAQIVIGVRRSGKSTMCHRFLRSHQIDYAYVNFDDDRLTDFGNEDLDTMLSSLTILYGDFSYLVDGSTGEILEDVGGLHPVLEAGQPPLPDLLPPFVGDDLPAGLQDHKPGDGRDVVPGPQLAVGEKRVAEGQRGPGQAAARLQGPAPPQSQLSPQSLAPHLPGEPSRWAEHSCGLFSLLAGSQPMLPQRSIR